jgi:hypothetical protein
LRIRTATIAALASLAVLALTGCGEPRSERPRSDREQDRPIVVEGSCGEKQTTTGTVDDLTRRQVLDRFAAALSCPGHVAHLTARAEHGADAEQAAVEYWLDIENSALRIHSGPETYYAPLQIVNDDGVFRRHSDDDRAEKNDHSPICSEYGEPLLPYLVDDECFFLGWGSDVSVESGEYNGRQAVVLRTQQLFPYGPDEEDGIVEYDTRVYFDGDTFVLLGVTNTGTLEGQSLPNEKFSVAYDVDFVALDSLEPDFFDPASIGYVQPVDQLDDLEGTLYWLGETLPASDGFSELGLDGVWMPQEPIEPGGYIGIVHYKPDVDLHEYTMPGPEDMHYWLSPPRSGACLSETVEIEVGSARAIIWGTSREENDDGSCGPATHYEARVFFEETMVTVITSENTGAEFDSLEGMEHVIRNLKRRE